MERRARGIRARRSTHAAAKSLANVLPTSNGFILCNRLSDRSLLFGEPQRIDVDSVWTCVNTRDNVCTRE